MIHRWLRSKYRRLRARNRSRAQIVADIKAAALIKAGDPAILELRIPPSMMSDIEAMMCDLHWSMSDVFSTSISVLARITKDGGTQFQTIRDGAASRCSLAVGDPIRKPKRVNE